MLTPYPIKAFDDNYIWCISYGDQALVVDPGCADSVIKHLQQQQLNLAGILITHHHRDHTGGIEQLIHHYGAMPVYGPDNQINAINHRLVTEQTISITVLGIELKANIILCPGHTLDHIAYHIDDMLFCGDSLFSVGCGRLFEGDARMALSSLQKYMALDANTRIFPTHEYTLANIAFAKSVESNNLALQAYSELCHHMRAQGLATLPTTLAAEMTVNPFLRSDQPEVITSAGFDANKAVDQVAVFTKIRQLKDSF